MKHTKATLNDRRKRALVHVQRRVEVFSGLIDAGATTTEVLDERDDNHWWTNKPVVLLSVKLAQAEYEEKQLRTKLRLV